MCGKGVEEVYDQQYCRVHEEKSFAIAADAIGVDKQTNNAQGSETNCSYEPRNPIDQDTLLCGRTLSRRHHDLHFMSIPINQNAAITYLEGCEVRIGG